MKPFNSVEILPRILPYILVLSLMDKKTYEKSFDGMATYVDYNAGYEDGSLLMTISRQHVDIPESPHCTSSTCQPLYEVLNSLETDGY